MIPVAGRQLWRTDPLSHAGSLRGETPHGCPAPRVRVGVGWICGNNEVKNDMKFKITMKDPDGAYDSIRGAAEESLEAISALSERERESLVESRHQELSEQARQWLRYGEYLTVEFDTEAGTATVLPASSN